MSESMNIYASPGTKVVYAFPNAGYRQDRKTASENLSVGTTYTIDHTDIHSWYTNVYLKEVPGIAFNSVHFEEE